MFQKLLLLLLILLLLMNKGTNCSFAQSEELSIISLSLLQCFVPGHVSFVVAIKRTQKREISLKQKSFVSIHREPRLNPVQISPCSFIFMSFVCHLHNLKGKCFCFPQNENLQQTVLHLSCHIRLNQLICSRL